MEGRERTVGHSGGRCARWKRDEALKRGLSDHFDGERFFNPEGAPPRGLTDLLRWKLTSGAAPSPDRIRDNAAPDMAPPFDEHETRITLVNHSTVLIQRQGRAILTDPVWSERASPVPWAGPKRHRAPGIALADLPHIDIVLISHNHYDHLDLATLRAIARRHSPAVLVPLGLAPLMRAAGFSRIEELDWWEESLGIHCVPARHFSARGLLDRNRTLWCGYAFHSPAGLICLAGDTAFGAHFDHIRERLGAPRIALLPIGAYEPRWFMQPVHMSPGEAVEAHHTLGAATSIAIHHGTFQLADESIDQPRAQLEMRLKGENFLIPRNGETIRIA